MMMSGGTAGDAGMGGTLRGILVIVVAGLALGGIHNAIGRASRPPRGLAWVKVADAPARLEALPPDSAAVAPPPAAKPGSVAATPSRTPAPPAAAPAPETPAAAPTTPAASPPVASVLPVIPALDRPIEIDLATLKKFHDAGAVLVVDAREAAEYEDGHIAGAVSLPYKDALADPGRIARLGEAGRPIVVYCSGNGCELSMDLAKLIIEQGRRKVLVYEGGWPEWASFEYPSARGAQAGGR